MASQLFLKPYCRRCGSNAELYGSNCKHMTVCFSCGEAMAQNQDSCPDCRAPLTCLIREYNVIASKASDRNYFLGKFSAGAPNFAKERNDENKWFLRKAIYEGSNEAQLKEKDSNTPWLLEDEAGQSQYHGRFEGAQASTYYILVLQEKQFVAIPAGSWYNFTRVAQYKQLTLEEAERKMKNKRKTVEGYERWMMKAAKKGPAAFGRGADLDDEESGIAGGKGRKRTRDDNEGSVSDNVDKNEEEETKRRDRLGLSKRSCRANDDEGDSDLDNDDTEMGVDWEHEEIFSDDDEAIGNNTDDDEETDFPAPPNFYNHYEDESDEEEEDLLIESGKELKRLLTCGMDKLDSEEDDADARDYEPRPVLKNENGYSSRLPVLSTLHQHFPRPMAKTKNGCSSRPGVPSIQHKHSPGPVAKIENGVSSTIGVPSIEQKSHAVCHRRRDSGFYTAQLAYNRTKAKGYI